MHGMNYLLILCMLVVLININIQDQSREVSCEGGYTYNGIGYLVCCHLTYSLLNLVSVMANLHSRRFSVRCINLLFGKLHSHYGGKPLRIFK